ncbi:MAG: hypothetical protein LBN95_10945 [Prevotellaceae bacterium]|jgi:hypothetical protein|nr:hypothetical protein [Prevotellaceae bacterium]
MLTINQIQEKWRANSEDYKTSEIGSGVHSFVKDVLTSPELLHLQETAKKTGKFLTFTHDTEKKKEGRPDFVIYAADDVTIPVEVKCFGRIKEGITQLFRYQLDYSKQYGILTDGNEWRFYRAGQYSHFLLADILEKTKEFLIFWNDYIKPEHYYSGIFNPTGQLQLFEEKLDLNDSENRKIFFDDTTNLIRKFMVKMRARGTFANFDDKKALETSYSYLIQFILFKVIVDNNYKNFTNWYKSLFKLISKYIYDKENYQSILGKIRMIADYVSSHIYKPFAKEQEDINKQLFSNLTTDLIIDDISPWLDNLIFIDKYNFGNLKNEIFGFIYENYLKDLYGENKGQYFTDPDVVNFMLEEVGYTAKEIKNQQDKISIIDPSCGAGTFLYSAVDAIIESFGNDFTKTEAQKIEKIISNNVFGLDIEEFPLYLAEMSILMKLLPLIINDNFENPIDEKIKVFKTKDSISEFLDAGIGATNPDIDFPMLFSKNELGYDSFMRDDDNLRELIESMQGTNGERLRFDFVVGNPPYVDYNSCSSKLKIPFIGSMRDKTYNSISMSDVYGVNLNTVPNGRIKTYSPKPNLYAFFIALSLALLKKGGKMCYIIPQTMLAAGDLDVLRYHLAKNVTIDKLTTFEGNVFVGRGLAQKNTVATSSLIFVVTKKTPEKNHEVEITTFKQYDATKNESFKIYFNGKRKDKVRYILQSELLENVENWNYIKQNRLTLKLLKTYSQKNLSIEEYRKIVLNNYDEITIDGNINIENKKIIDVKPDNADCYLIPRLNKKYFSIQKYGYFDKANRIKTAQGSQNINLTLNKKYKIVWRYQNSNGFYYTEKENVLPNFSIYSIASHNKNIILFLFALLRSPINAYILEKYLKMANEKSFLVGLSSIKNFIRIPKITPENQSMKDKIIDLTEKMLDLEKVTLYDLVDFKSFTIQKFENIEVVSNNITVTFNNKDYKLPIKEKTDFVKKLIAEKYYDNGLIFNQEAVTLQELKNLEAIDFDEQAKLKTEIDDLVFELYFGNENEEFKKILNN